MTYNVGIIGTNFGASYHLPAYQTHSSFEVHEIAGKNFEKANDIAEKHGITAATEWQSITENPDLDVISIATPPNLHFPMAMAALRNGKHVLLEKPTALNAQEAFQIKKLAQKQSVTGVIAHEWRFYQPNQVLYNLLHNEKLIGDIEMIRAQDLLSYAFNARYSWEYNRDLGGGWLGIAGSHIVDLLRFLCQSEIIKVSGTLGIRIPERKDKQGKIRQVTAEDYFSASFEMETGINGLIDHLPTLNPAPASRLIVSGTKGTLYTEGSNILIPEKMFLANHGSNYENIQLDRSTHSIVDMGIGGVMHDLFQLLLDDFSLQISGGDSRAPTLEEGWKNQLVLDGIKRSANTNQTVQLEYQNTS